MPAIPDCIKKPAALASSGKAKRLTAGDTDDSPGLKILEGSNRSTGENGPSSASCSYPETGTLTGGKSTSSKQKNLLTSFFKKQVGAKTTKSSVSKIQSKKQQDRKAKDVEIVDISNTSKRRLQNPSGSNKKRTCVDIIDCAQDPETKEGTKKPLVSESHKAASVLLKEKQNLMKKDSAKKNSKAKMNTATDHSKNGTKPEEHDSCSSVKNVENNQDFLSDVASCVLMAFTNSMDWIIARWVLCRDD